MTKPQVAHETIVIRRAIRASSEQVFRAWADPEARKVWGPPSDDEAIEFLEVDVRIGGKDVHVCGRKGDLRFRVETSYHAIDEPTQLLFSESVSAGDDVLGVSLIAVDLAETGEATSLAVTVQVASLVGEPLLAGNRNGWESAVENLRRYLEEPL